MANDVLGPHYSATTIPLRPDDEGEVVATLIERGAGAPSRRAVLYVHGFVDYFFQTHLADAWIADGFDFYALDLRKYGRSLRAHQTPNYCTDLSAYFEELDEAARIIHETHDTLVVIGHSTGGLITSYWAHERRDTGVVDALVLNSPWFDLNENWATRVVASRAVDTLALRFPKRPIVSGLPPFYGESIHAGHDGEWDYDLRWKPLHGFPVTAGFLRAVHRVQLKLAKGFAIDCPALVCASAASGPNHKWSEQLRTSDCVLNVEHMVQRAPRLGPDVTIVQIPGGIHDLALSAEPARSRYFDEVSGWTRANVL
jgi:alpha-beta hydrolase superfamily lysophospholipase